MLNLFATNCAKTITKSSLSVRTVKTLSVGAVKWVRPEKPQSFGRVRSGDIGVYVPPDSSNICLQYQYATELDNAEPNVRNQFTLGWHDPERARDFYEKTLMDSVRSHQYDYKSQSALIAQITGAIRFMQHQIENNEVHDKKRCWYKKEVRYLIPKRMQLLKIIRETDYKQYEFLLERLDLQYKPKPAAEDEIMIARKEGLRLLTKEYCDDIRKQKLRAYKQELETQQLPFLEQKIANLEFIRNEQISLRIPVTIEQQQIDECRKQYEAMKIEYDSRKIEPTKKKWKVY